MLDFFVRTFFDASAGIHHIIHQCPTILTTLMQPLSLTFALLAGHATATAIVHYPPSQSNINNLTFALSGDGPPGIFNSSTTPDAIYGIYNWCNMPHVRKREYTTPSKDFTLLYVEVIHRHHKRTPYASNTFFKESVPWSCDAAGPVYGGRSSTGDTSSTPQVDWQATTNPQNPFTNTVGPGFVNSTCQFPQITTEGLEDSIAHGSDLRDVYASRLGLKSSFDPSTVQIRVTNNQITSQVASGLLKGLFPSTPASTVLPALIQSSSFDSLEPAYSCPKASSIKNGYTTGSNGAAWQAHLSAAAAVYAQLDKVSGIDSGDGGWHMSFDHYYDNLSAKQCHGKSLPCNVNDTSLCVSQDLANTVYRLGNWEYSYQFRDAPDSTQYSTLNYGAWVLELRSRLQAAAVRGGPKIKYVHNIAHDGSISPLLGFLQIANMVWPGMGSEVVFELYTSDSSSKSSPSYFVRVLWGGQPMLTSTELGKGGLLDMVPLDDLFAYIDSMIGTPSDLLAGCNSN